LARRTGLALFQDNLNLRIKTMPKPLLPQNDTKPTRRAKRLRKVRQQYQYNYSYLNPIAFVNGIPNGEFPDIDWIFKVARRLSAILINNFLNDDDPGKKQSDFSTGVSLVKILSGMNSEENVEAKFKDLMKLFNFDKAGEGKDLEDYRELFSALELPAISHNFQEDKIFARMRVAGPNPMMLARVAQAGKTILNKTFPVTDDIFRSVQGFTNDSMAQAIRENRLYMVDYAALDGMQSGSSPDGQKYVYAPKALFAVPTDPGAVENATLLPIAIQCGQQPSKFKLITPGRGKYNWLMAKTVVQIADGNYHELISHLGATHLLIEPFVGATHRRLYKKHPLYILLKPHFEGTVFINWEAQKTLIAPGGIVDQLLAATIQSAREFAAKTLRNLSFNDRMLPQDLNTRGVLSSRLDYPYRDDAEDLWDALKTWVSSYLSIYYRNDGDVREDFELRSWALEIASENGGRVHGFGEDGNGAINTLTYLIDAATMIIFTASAQHAAVNFPQNDIMSFNPAMPLAGYAPAPNDNKIKTVQDWMKMLPALKTAELQLAIGSLLGGVYHTRLGEYGKRYFDDKRVEPHLAELQAELEEIETDIKQRNMETLGNGVEAYHYLRPSEIPQSINI
jgi:arachidonate 15-lipoxygenase